MTLLKFPSLHFSDISAMSSTTIISCNALERYYDEGWLHALLLSFAGEREMQTRNSPFKCGFISFHIKIGSQELDSCFSFFSRLLLLWITSMKITLRRNGGEVMARQQEEIKRCLFWEFYLETGNVIKLKWLNGDKCSLVDGNCALRIFYVGYKSVGAISPTNWFSLSVA